MGVSQRITKNFHCIVLFGGAIPSLLGGALRDLAVRTVANLPKWLRHRLYLHHGLRNRLARILKRLVPADGTQVVTVSSGPLRGMRLCVDRNTPNYYWIDDRHEAEVTAMLQKHAKSGTVVADIGAHIGFHTLILSRSVGEEGMVLAFEPDPTNLGRLRKNLELNQLRNVRVFNRAVAKSTGAFYFEADGSTTSHLICDEPAPEKAIKIQTVSLDDLFYKEHAPMASLLKVDVEGHEADVLQGATRFLKEMRPPLLLEVHHEQAMVDCLTLLTPLGYEFTPLENKGKDFIASALRGRPIPGFSVCHIACFVGPRNVTEKKH